MKLLVIDDHPASRRLIREIAVHPGDVVRECPSGEAALELVGTFDPDVVTVDLMLDGMSGFSALRLLRQRCPRARHVVVTGYDDPSLQVAALALGAIAYVCKDRLVELRTVLDHGPAFSPSNRDSRT